MKSSSYEQVSIRLWPFRALTVEQEDELLQQWEQELQSHGITHRETHLHTQIQMDHEDEALSAEDVVNLIACALDLDNVAMIDVYAVNTSTKAEMAFRVHLDHPPIRQLCDIYRRRIIDPWQTLACFQRINLTEGTYAKTADLQLA